MIRKPAHLDPLSDRILTLLAGRPEAGEIILGGYFALQHYAGYRNTHDIDAWWRGRADPAAERAIREAMANVAAAEGLEMRERRFGETLSFELIRQGRRLFSFQIALRSVGLEPPQPSAWPPVLIETLADNLGSKMNALVDRGAPRDFTDVYQVVHIGLLSAARCWELWALKNPETSLDVGRQKVHYQLTALERRRPLESIRDPDERNRAAEIRRWFRTEFARTP